MIRTLRYPWKVSPGAARANSSNSAIVKKQRIGPDLMAWKSKMPSGNGGLNASLFFCRNDHLRSHSASGMDGSMSTIVADVRLRYVYQG